MGSVPAPHDRRGFEIALICALPLEAECVQEVFDKFWEDEGKKYEKAAGDPNVYTTGVIGDHNVVLAYMPGMGTTSAAAVAGAMRVSFSNIKLALVVGICGGIPYDADGNEILLGDVIISQALIQYDFGRQYPEGFRRKTGVQDTLGRPSPEIRAIQAKLRTSRYRQKMQEDIATFLEDLAKKLPETKPPARENDILYHSSYVHQHHPPEVCECSRGDQICVTALQMDCEDLGCEATMRVPRNRLGKATTKPIVHFGITGSGNTVMKSGRHRDQIAKVDGIIAFEMEGAGVWDYFPSIVIKGVCDYTDSHKRKGWQRYAAATAASCMKAFLVEWAPQERPTNPVDEISAKTYFVVPVQRVKDFIGRQEELRQIKSYFHQQSDRPRTLVLHAMGGQGKSQIALEYCQQQRKIYRGIFWINSSSKSTLTQAIIGVGREINAAAIEALSDDDAKIAFTLRTLEQWEDRWLMVFDNCDDPATFPEIEHFIPQGGKGDVLLTSRHRGLGELGHIIDIPQMPDKAGVELLLHRYVGVNVNDHISEGSTIVRRLGGLALAIDQASAYMAYQQLPIDQLSDFLAHFEAERKKVLQHTADHFWRYMKINDENGRGKAISAFTTWEMSFQQFLSVWDPPRPVEHFLTLTAFLGPTRVSESLFKFHRELEDPPPDWCDIFTTSCRSDDDSSSSDAEEEVGRQEHVTRDRSAEAKNTGLGPKKTWDTECFWRLIRQAHQMSLLQSILPSTPSEGAGFVLHPLIRDWLQLRLRSKERQTYTHEVVDVIVSSIRTYRNRDSDATIKRSVLLHMDATLSTVRDFLKDGYRLGQDITNCDNADWFASFYRDQGQFDTSLDLYRTVVMTRERVLGKEHPDTLTSMNNLALVLRDQGKYEAAEQIFREVGEVTERILGKEHPDTLTSMNNLARVLSDQGKYEAAEQIFREVGEVRERILGKEHPFTLTSMNNLAGVLSDQGKYEAAEQMHREVGEVMERILGKEHPDMLTSMNNLAGVLSDQGKYEAAEQIHREVGEVTERILGKEHPDMLTSMNNLAGVLSDQGKYEAAEQIFREVGEVTERILGKEHPSTLTSMNNLAGVLSDQGKYEAAEQIFREVGEVRERILGKEHPSTLTSINNLALVLSDQGKYEAAEQMHREVGEVTERILGKEHPDTLTSMNNLARVLSDQGKYEAAEQMHREVGEVMERILGKEHPDMLTSMNNLAGVLSDQGKYEAAEQIFREVGEVRERILGKEHLSTLTSMNNLAGVLSDQGKYEVAEQIFREVGEVRERILGKEHPDTLTSINNLAGVLSDQGKYEAAEQIFREVGEVTERILGKEHPDTLTSMNNLALVLSDQRQYKEAEKIQSGVVVRILRVFRLDHPNSKASMNTMLAIWEQQGMEERAREKALLELLIGVVHGATPLHRELEEISGDGLADPGVAECQGHAEAAATTLP